MIVQELMTEDPLTLDRNQSLELAQDLLRFAHIRHLPVIENGKVVGLVTHRDLLRAVVERSSEALPAIPIERVMRTDIRTIDATVDVREAVEIMIDHKYGCLPVTSGEQLVGILTEADFLKYVKRALQQRELD